ncbi:MAG: dihydrofolate reductase family protein, partial [Armatimonadota bacterium]
ERVFSQDPFLWLVRTASSPPQTEPIGWSVPELLATIWSKGCTGVMVEGGPGTWGSFLASGLVDRLDLFVAPTVFGAGPSWLSTSENWAPDGRRFELASSSSIGDDLWLRYSR